MTQVKHNDRVGLKQANDIPTTGPQNYCTGVCLDPLTTQEDHIYYQTQYCCVAGSDSKKNNKNLVS